MCFRYVKNSGFRTFYPKSVIKLNGLQNAEIYIIYLDPKTNSLNVGDPNAVYNV